MTVVVVKTGAVEIIGLYVVGITTGVGWKVTQPVRRKLSRKSLYANRIIHQCLLFYSRLLIARKCPTVCVTGGAD
jgi:hypothetical protein